LGAADVDLAEAVDSVVLAVAHDTTSNAAKEKSNVIPAKAGIQRLWLLPRVICREKTLDSRVRGNDEPVIVCAWFIARIYAVLGAFRSGKNIAKNAGAAIR
jgi:hypothetical protein